MEQERIIFGKKGLLINVKFIYHFYLGDRNNFRFFGRFNLLKLDHLSLSINLLKVLNFYTPLFVIEPLYI